MDDDSITFLMGPGACPDDPAAERLLREHEAEAERLGVEFTNYGWGTSDYGIASKTTKGILSSQIDPETMNVIHRWETYEDRERQRAQFMERAARFVRQQEMERLARQGTVH
jgi:hypothetical protein